MDEQFYVFRDGGGSSTLFAYYLAIFLLEVSDGHKRTLGKVVIDMGEHQHLIGMVRLAEYLQYLLTHLPHMQVEES